MLLLALYSASVIALPAGSTVDTSMNGGDPPKSISLARSGSAGFILQAADGKQPASKVLIVRADGSRVILHLPPDSVLAGVFKQYALGPNGEHRFPAKHFTAIALADDGTPFLTVSAPFFGAFTGIDQGVFIWNGEWRNAYPNGVPIETGNVDIGAASSISHFVSNGNYFNYFAGPIDGEPQHYQEDQVLLTKMSQAQSLGFGDATAIRGSVVVGYAPGRQTITSPDSVQVNAVEWAEGQMTRLGPGIARGVNAAGVVIGDDRAKRNEPSHPTLWLNGTAHRISASVGSAYAIDDDGNIVGSLRNDAFIARWDGKTVSVRRIDALLVDHRWHITAAFGIAKAGGVLALGRRGTGPMKLLLLHPSAK